MSITKISISEFLSLAGTHIVLDVRSPGEYLHGHIPGAYSLPLFSDDERKIVGTAYKQEGQQKAIKLGLDSFGKSMVSMIESVESIVSIHRGINDDAAKRASDSSKETRDASRGTLLVHCWRGGMRSAGVAWLLDLYGFRVYTLVGGYKSYRRWAQEKFTDSYDIHVIGGYTGSGKTSLLTEFARRGNSVIDVEALAVHKGSAFGNLQQLTQPTQEMFENLLATELAARKDERIWMEDESQRIGLVNLPGALFRTIHRQQLFFLNIPFEQRLDHIMTEYGNAKHDDLEPAILRIRKRLGGVETTKAIAFLTGGDIRSCFAILLRYYDKFYIKALDAWRNASTPMIQIDSDSTDPRNNYCLFSDVKQPLNE